MGPMELYGTTALHPTHTEEWWSLPQDSSRGKIILQRSCICQTTPIFLPAKQIYSSQLPRSFSPTPTPRSQVLYPSPSMMPLPQVALSADNSAIVSSSTLSSQWDGRMLFSCGNKSGNCRGVPAPGRPNSQENNVKLLPQPWGHCR